MELMYDYDHDKLEIEVKSNGADKEVLTRCLDPEMAVAYKRVQAFFERDDIHTDVLFYTRQNHTYQAIVRQDYYVPFILEMFREQLLSGVRWE